MIEDVGCGFEVSCDECGDTAPGSSHEFREAVENARNAGWAVFKERGEWVHHCPDCRSFYSAAEDFA